jgi:hypothetical protein
MARGHELDQRAAPRVRPRRGPAACSRRACSRGARGALAQRARLPLDVPVYPYPPIYPSPCILCVVMTLFILMKWKLNSEIDYVSYFI